MNLQLSRNSPRNTVLCLPEGQAMYKIVTPKKFGGRTTTVSKIAPNKDVENMQDSFVELAQIDWPLIGQNVLTYQGQQIPARSYLRPDGLLYRHRAFQGPDGRMYRWNLGLFGMSSPVLERADETHERVAKFRQKCRGPFLKSRDAHLQVFSGGLGMVDEIVITFIFVEKLRRDREEQSRRGGGGGP